MNELFIMTDDVQWGKIYTNIDNILGDPKIRNYHPIHD